MSRDDATLLTVRDLRVRFPLKATALFAPMHYLYAVDGVSFAIAQLFAPLTALLGVAGIFAALAAVCAASCAAMSAFVLETKGLGLEEIEARFAEAAGASRGRPRRSISA